MRGADGDDAELDRLVRAFAHELPRRSAVKLLLGGLFGLAMFKARRAGADDGKRHGCADKKHIGACTTSNVCGTDVPVGDGNVGCRKHCCYDDGGKCCKYTGSSGLENGFCCGPGFDCDLDARRCVCNGDTDANGGCNCPEDRKCGETCCPSGQTCIRQGYSDQYCATICPNEHARGATQIYDPKTQCCTQYGIQPKQGNWNVAQCDKRVANGTKATANGCGDANHKVTSQFTTRRGKVIDFGPACQKHDLCYGTCNSDKSTCDDAFEAGMKKACKGARGKERAACIGIAGDYRTAVTVLAGGNYDDAQREVCNCCP